MADLTVREISQSGSTPAPVSASSAGDQFIAGPRTFLRVANTGGTTCGVTITRARSALNQPGYGDIPIADIAVTVPATTGIREIAVPPESHAASGLARVTYSGVTGVTVEAIKLPQI